MTLRRFVGEDAVGARAAEHDCAMDASDRGTLPILSRAANTADYGFR